MKPLNSENEFQTKTTTEIFGLPYVQANFNT